MKKVVSALALVAVVLLSSCGSKVSNPLIGSWKLVDISLPKVELVTDTIAPQMDSLGVTGVDTAMKEMTKGVESMANAMSGVGEAMANAFLKGSTYEFKDNGKVEVSILFGTQEGTYSVTPDNKDVKITLDGKDQSYKVTSATAKELVLTTDAGETWKFEAK